MKINYNYVSRILMGMTIAFRINFMWRALEANSSRPTCHRFATRSLLIVRVCHSQLQPIGVHFHYRVDSNKLLFYLLST